MQVDCRMNPFAQIGDRIAVQVYITWSRRVGVLAFSLGLVGGLARRAGAESETSTGAGATNVMAMSFDQLLDVNVDKAMGGG